MLRVKPFRIVLWPSWFSRLISSARIFVSGRGGVIPVASVSALLHLMAQTAAVHHHSGGAARRWGGCGWGYGITAKGERGWMRQTHHRFAGCWLPPPRLRRAAAQTVAAKTSTAIVLISFGSSKKRACGAAADCSGAVVVKPRAEDGGMGADHPPSLAFFATPVLIVLPVPAPGWRGAGALDVPTSGAAARWAGFDASRQPDPVCPWSYLRARGLAELRTG